MKLVTSVEINKNSLPTLSHHDEVMMLGSCFSENIGQKFAACGFHTDINPFGIIYNPLSIAKALDRIIDGTLYSDGDLFCHDRLWHSYMHHGSFSSTEKKWTLESINERLEKAHKEIGKVTHLYLTFGTAYVYSLKADGSVVSNCHKMPESTFERRLSSVDEAVKVCKESIDRLLKINKKVKIILTVSPVRHLRDGLHANDVSKATLLFAVDRLAEAYPKNVSYFPAYEIMMDELRDYRFYAEDMMHPSDLAVDYIWERLSDSCFDKETKTLAGECEEIHKAFEHRPLHADDEMNMDFLRKITLKIERLNKKYPYLGLQKL
jgi:hypothetical protein